MTIVKKTLLEDINNVDCDAVLVPMSIYNSMSNGFAYDIALNFPDVKEKESKTPYADRRKYGTCEIIESDSGITFIMCYMHNGGYSKTYNGEYVDYDSLKECLTFVNTKFKGKKILSPLLGSSSFDGNGNNSRIEKIFKDVCKDIDLHLYIYKQQDYKYDMFCKISELHKKLTEHTITFDEYIIKRSELEWLRTKGMFIPKPVDYVFKPSKRNK